MASTSFPHRTFDEMSKIFDRVKEEYESDDVTLAIIPEERYPEVYTIMSDHFITDEPLCSTFGVKWHPEFQKIVDNFLRENMSVMMVSRETNEIMGVRISGKMTSSDDISVLTTIPYLPLRELFIFVVQKEEELKFYERFGISEAFHFFAIAIHRKYRRMGLGTKLMGACVAFARELGYKFIRSEGSSTYSQRIFRNYGFEELAELPYDTYMHKGQPIRNGTGVHTKTVLFVKRL